MQTDQQKINKIPHSRGTPEVPMIWWHTAATDILKQKRTVACNGHRLPNLTSTSQTHSYFQITPTSQTIVLFQHFIHVKQNTETNEK